MDKTEKSKKKQAGIVLIAGFLLLKDLKSYKKAVSDFQKAHNIK